MSPSHTPLSLHEKRTAFRLPTDFASFVHRTMGVLGALIMLSPGITVLADGGRGGGGTAMGGTGYTGNPGENGSLEREGGGGGAAGGGAGGVGGSLSGVGGGGTSGAGGTAGSPNGGNGGEGTQAQAGGGGGGGGYNGNGSGTATLNNSSVLTGGNGGNGGAGSSMGGGTGGGGGGAGGYGAVVTGNGSHSNSSIISGGTGGVGGDARAGAIGGAGGDGGVGAIFTSGGTFTNTGTVGGGSGGNVGNGSYFDDWPPGKGGVGVIGSDLTIINSGAIIGGQGGNSSAQADAIAFTGGHNTLTLGSSFSITGNISVSGVSTGSTTLNLNQQSNAATLSNVITGNGAVIKTGDEVLTLSGSNTFTGGMRMNEGTLAVSENANLGNTSGGLTFGGGTLRSTATFTTARATLINAGGGTFEVESSTTLTHSGVISGAGALTKSGTGTLILSGTNTYEGGTTLNAGTISVSANANLGDADGALTFNGGTLGTTATVTMDRGITLNASGGTMEVAASTTATQQGVIDGLGGLTKTGGGILILSGTNTYQGGTAINEGHLFISQNANLGNASGGLSFDGGTLSTTAGLSMNRATTLNAGGGTFSVGSGTLTQSGAITGVGALTKAGTGILTLSGTNSYEGGTNINGGTLVVSADANLGDASGTLSFNGGILSVATGFAMSRDTTLNAGGGIFSVGAGTLTHSGAIEGAGGLTKTGSGTMTLSETNSYQGGTTVTGGVLSISSNANLGNASGGLTLNGGTLLTTASFTLNRATTLGSSHGTFNVGTDPLTHSGAISGAGKLIKTGTGALTLSGSNVFTGGIDVQDGLLIVANTAAAGSSSSTIIGGAYSSTATIQINSGVSLTKGVAFDNGGTLDNRGSISTARGLLSQGGGTLQNSGTIASTDEAYAGVYIQTGSGTITNSGTITGQRANAVNLINGGSITNEDGGLIEGSSLNDTLWSGISIEGGTSTVDNLNGSTIRGRYNGLSTISPTTVTNSGGSTIEAIGSDAEAAIFFDNGGGSSSLTNSVGSTVSGRTFGVYLVGGGTITNEGTITARQAGTGQGVVFAAATGILINKGTINGHVNFSNFANELTLHGGSVIDGNLNLGTSTSSTLTLDGAADETFSTAVTGTTTFHGDLVMNGTGIWTIDANLSNVASTEINSGELKMNGSIGGSILVASGGKLGGTGTLTGIATVEDGGILAAGNSPGTLTVGGLVLSNDSILDFELGTVSDLVVVNGNLTLDGLLNVTAEPGFGIGTYDLFQYTGSLLDNGVIFNLMPGAYDYVLDTSVANVVQLAVSAVDALYWNGTSGVPTTPGGAGGNGTWTNDPSVSNWTNATGTLDWEWTAGERAIFGGATGTVTVADTVSVSEIRFLTDNYVLTGPGELEISGPTLTILVDPNLEAEINTVISGTGSVNKTGAGELYLTGNNTHQGGTTVSGGSLYISDGEALGTGDLTLRNGTTFGVAAGNIVFVDNETHILGTVNIVAETGDLIEFAEAVHLGGATRTIVATGSGQICFANEISGAGGLTLLASNGTPEVMMCGSASNSYTGLTTVSDGVTLALLKDSGAVSIQGDLLIQQGGTVLLEDFPNQINAASTVQVDGRLEVLAIADLDMQQIGFLQGSGTVTNMWNDAALRISAGNFSGTITEDISATGGLAIVKNGAGTLALRAASTYTGGTVIDSGILQTYHQQALGAGVVELNGGALAVLAPLTIESLNWNGGTIAMALGSTPSLLIDGTLTMTTTGLFEFSGGVANTPYIVMTFDTLGSTVLGFSTTPQAGQPVFTLVDNGDGTTSLQLMYVGRNSGPVLSNDAPYYVAPDADFLVEGSVTTWSTTQNNAVNSLTFANGSSLNVFNRLTVTSGDFTVEEGSASISGGVVIVPGDFTKLGDGALIASSNFSVGGEANIEEGALYVNGIFQTEDGLNVLEDAFLGGSGLIVGDVTNDGTVAPGNSPGVLTINGNFVQTSSGTLQIEVESGSVFDQLFVTGNADIDGTLEIISSNLSYGQAIPFLVAGSITGAFEDVIMPNEDLFRARMLIDDGVGIVLVAPTSYTLVAETQNQTNVAAALDSFIPAQSGDRQTVSIALDQLTAEQYPSAFDQISPAFYESLADITLEQNNAQNQMLAQRFSSVRLGARGFQSMGVAQSPIMHDKDGKSVLDAKSSKDIITPTEDNNWGLWVMGNGLFANAPSVGQMKSYKFQSGGFLGGVDYSWSEHFATGVFAGYQGLYAKYDGGSKNTINSTNFGTYATFQKDGFTADAIVSGAYNSYSTRRPIEFGTVDRTGVATPDGGQVNAYLGLGYDWKAGNFTFGPILSAQYTYVGIGSFEESGADSLDLRVQQQNAHSIRSSVGGRIAYTWNVTEHIVLIPEVRMLWQHEFLNNPRTIGAALDGGSGPSFDYLTSAPGRDAVYAGAGITAQFGRNWNANLFYNADFGRQDFTSHMVSGGLTWEF